MELFTILISVIALLVSLATFWLTRIRSGAVKMTKPTVIFFGPDGPGENLNKVFIRTLLYSTADKGQYIENMYAILTKDNFAQNFNIWVYGDKNEGLSRGSGLFVSKHGIASNHHFLMPKDGSKFDFKAGIYSLEIFVELVNKNPKRIYKQALEVTKAQEESLSNKLAGIYFDWAPDKQEYRSHIDDKPIIAL